MKLSARQVETAKSEINDQGYSVDWIELQQAHVDKNVIRGTYNHALYLDGRHDCRFYVVREIPSFESCRKSQIFQGYDHFNFFHRQ